MPTIVRSYDLNPNGAEHMTLCQPKLPHMTQHAPAEQTEELGWVCVSVTAMLVRQRPYMMGYVLTAASHIRHVTPSGYITFQYLHRI